MVYTDKLSQFKEAIKNRRSDLVLIHGTPLLLNYRRKLGDEYWTVAEQVLLAALDYRHDDWSIYCLKILKSKFPGSVRVNRLRAMILESRGSYGEAATIYTDILKDKPEDVICRKRLISIQKAKGNTNGAVDALNKYLDDFPGDVEAWHELAELYMAENNLSKATFCFEELVMHEPRSLYNAVTYAELLYSIADFETSRKYYCLALQLDDTNLRALWGLALVNEHIPPAPSRRSTLGGGGSPSNAQTSSTKAKGGSAEVSSACPTKELSSLSLLKIKRMYAKVDGKHAETALEVVSALSDAAANRR